MSGSGTAARENHQRMPMVETKSEVRAMRKANDGDDLDRG